MTLRAAARAGALWGAVALGASATACGPSGNLAEQLAKPPELELEGQTQCKLRKSPNKPLIVEWPSADRAELEAKLSSNIVVVAYQGCEMRLLSHCSAGGRYGYTAVTPKQDSLRIRNADELYAAIPIGAAGFEAKLASHGELTIAMTMVGRWSAEPVDVYRAQLVGRCDGATHVLSGLTVGAFEFFAGADAEVGAGAEVMGVGAGAKSKAGRQTLTRDGSPEACLQQGDFSQSPPPSCAALLRVEVLALLDGPPPEPEPPAAPPRATAPEPSTDSPESTDCPEATTRQGRYCKCPAGKLWANAKCQLPAEPSYPNVGGSDTSALVGRWRGLGDERARYVFYADGSCWWAMAGTRGDEWLGEGELCVNPGCRYLVSGDELSIFLAANQIRCTTTEEPRFTAERRQQHRFENKHLVLTTADETQTYRSVFVRATGRLLRKH